MTIVQALKKLGKKCNTGGTEPTGSTISDVLESIESDFNISGSKGDDGASMSALELTVDGSGAVTGGTATLTDGTEITVTVTTASAGGGD